MHFQLIIYSVRIQHVELSSRRTTQASQTNQQREPESVQQASPQNVQRREIRSSDMPEMMLLTINLLHVVYAILFVSVCFLWNFFYEIMERFFL